MWIRISVGLLVVSLAVLALERAMPHTGGGRLAHRLLSLRLGSPKRCLTGRRAVWFGIAWKTLFVLGTLFLKSAPSERPHRQRRGRVFIPVSVSFIFTRGKGMLSLCR